MERDDPRIDALIARMTPEEKAGQLSTFSDKIRQGAAFGINPDTPGEGGPKELLDAVRAGKVGSLFNGLGVDAGLTIQKAAVEESRLGIPVLLGADVIHGLWTVFPIPLGEAASFEPELAQRTARATAVESTGAGIHWTFAPMVDVARDQRWGRVAESSGEDTFLASSFATARVRGFHGPNLLANDALLACPKHFAAYGAVSAGMEYNFVEVSEATLRDVHLPPFKAAFDAGALTVMSSFNDVAGVPASGNRWLMTELLRGEWGFKGFVVSDFTADLELIAHGYASDDRDAAKKAFVAGVDVSMESALYNRYLPQLAASGDIPQDIIDEGVRRVLRVKVALGLLDNPYRSLDPKQAKRTFYMPEHHTLAREAGKRSIVLLKNSGAVLPLRKSGQRIALIGPFASDTKNLVGCWAMFGISKFMVGIEAGIRGALTDPGMLSVAPGSNIESALEGGLTEAVKVAEQSDVVLLAVGEAQKMTGESQSRTQITLPAAQLALVEAVAATKKPVVILLKTGRALALTGALRQADAILVTWFLGSQTGPAIADVVFGDYSPSARLPVSFPQDAGQQPYFYNHVRTGRPAAKDEPRYFKARYREVSNEALYPFGHGLTYTSFEYGAPRLSAKQLAWDEALSISASVRNTGSRPGEEVVQLYLHDRVASRVRPVRELRGFRKLHLDAGESKDVVFRLTRLDLGFHDAKARLIVEPGLFDVWVAPSSAEGVKTTFELMPTARL